MRFHRLLLLLPVAILATGCHTYVYAPGATGHVVDAQTGSTLRGVTITRLIAAHGYRSSWAPPENVSVASDHLGRFNLPPATETEFLFMYRHNPESISGAFLISAPGYSTNALEGNATSRTLWRVDLGRVAMKKE